MLFRWYAWNLGHVIKHGVDPLEAEMIISHAKRPYPHRIGDEKWLAIGSGQGGRWVQIIFIYDPDDVTVYIIHARPLNEREKRRLRRRRK